MAYITKAELEQYTGLTISAGLQTFIDTVIAGATQYIEKFTGRKFEAPTPDTDKTRYYDGNGATKLAIDDLRSLTSLTVDDVALTVNEDFYLYPLNATEDGVPYERIELIQPETRLAENSRVDSASPYIFDKGQRTVTVVGKFNYSATPPSDVKLACMKLCGGVIKENIGDNDLKELTAESLGEYSMSFAKISDIAHALKVDEMLKQYIRADKRGTVGSKGRVVAGFIQVN